jgi:hypothetical protein
MNKAGQEPIRERSAAGAGNGMSLWLTLAAAALLLLSLKYPLWQMHLEAPQYRGSEALHVAVNPNGLRGDLRELAVLNQYIGVHVPSTLPQFKWLPATLVAGALLGIGAGLVPLGIRRQALLAAALALAAALGTAALQAHSQIYEIGHHRDAHAPLAGVQDFTPPLLGTARIAQFDVSSRLGFGAWLIGAGLALQLGAAASTNPRSASPRLATPSTEELGLLAAAAPEPRS